MLSAAQWSFVQVRCSQVLRPRAAREREVHSHHVANRVASARQQMQSTQSGSGALYDGGTKILHNHHRPVKSGARLPREGLTR